jgi:nucleoid DNA-binding protein
MANSPRPLATLLEREFCQAVADRLDADPAGPTDIDATVVNEVFGACLDEIAMRLAEQRKVTLRGFGVFEARVSRPVKRYRPGTTETVEVPAKLRPMFRVAEVLKTRVNAEYMMRDREAS